MKRVFDIVPHAQDAALAAARPGVPCDAVDAAARKVIVTAGYGPGFKYFTHRVGHGIGLDGHEWPYLTATNTLLTNGKSIALAPHMTFSDEPGVYIPGEFGVRLEDAGFPDILAVLRGGAPAKAKIENWIYNPPSGAAFSLDSVTLLAPIPRPPKLICVGLNYRDHALESKMEIPKVPTIFAKFATAVIGPGHPIVLPKNSTQPDYEAEFAFVIVTGGRHIPAEEWEQHVFGYTLLNDVSARDFQMA